MSAVEPKRETKILGGIALSYTLTIAAFPILANLLIFTYYSGYFNVFRMPIQLITFDFTSVFVVSGGLLVLAFLLYYYGDLLFSAFKPLPAPIARRLQHLLITAFFLLMIYSLYSDYLLLVLPGLDTGTALFSFSLAMAILVIVEFRPRSGKGTYLGKLAAADELEDKAIESQEPSNPIEKIIRGAKREGVLIALIFFFVHSAGRYYAFTQKEFYVANTSPETVVLWMTSDKAVCATFDRNTKIVEANFMILDMTKTTDLKLRLETVGPLHTGLISQSVKPVPP